MLAKQTKIAMNNSADSDTCEQEFKLLLTRLEALTPMAAGERALLFAARLVETAAFDVAGKVASEDVGRLIEIAVELSSHAGQDGVNAFAELSADKQMVN